MSARLIVPPGTQFGKLTIVKELPRHTFPSGRSRRRMECSCACGQITSALLNNLTSGHVTSCGCIGRASGRRNKTHGQSRTLLYGVWCTMRNRCSDPTNISYPNYGGRGITVCKDWQVSFSAFFDWAMASGYRKGLTIERNQNSGDYCPSNCSWVSNRQQQRNTRRNHLVTYQGITKPLVVWCEELGIPYSRTKARIYAGWSASYAFTVPRLTGRSSPLCRTKDSLS